MDDSSANELWTCDLARCWESDHYLVRVTHTDLRGVPLKCTCEVEHQGAQVVHLEPSNTTTTSEEHLGKATIRLKAIHVNTQGL